jgi:hypothetical protein
MNSLNDLISKRIVVLFFALLSTVSAVSAALIPAVPLT